MTEQDTLSQRVERVDRITREIFIVEGSDVDGLVALIRDLEADRQRLQGELDIIQRGKSPCGHWSAYAYIADAEGTGKHIDCWQCCAEKAELDRQRLREALQLAQTNCRQLADRMESAVAGLGASDGQVTGWMMICRTTADKCAALLTPEAR